jgi:hypothetical protein
MDSPPTLHCPRCGAAVATTAQPGTLIACQYCGAELRVPRATGGPDPTSDLPPAHSAPEPAPEPIVVPPERITVIPPGGRRRWPPGANGQRLSTWLALAILLCCGLPVALSLLCVATGLAGQWGGR